jgi:ferric-dicitrate binding protein FerR (iron transport regulator)
MTDDQIKNILLKKVRRVELSLDEQRQLEEWLSASDENTSFLSQIMDEHQLAAELKIIQNISTEAIWKKISNDLQLNGAIVKQIDKKSTKARRYWMYAAAAAVLFAIAIPLYRLQTHSNQAELAQQDTIKKFDLPPASNKATLTLADGSVIVLSDSVHGVIGQQSGSTIKVNHSGEVAYTSSGNSTNAGNEFNTIRTPKGGQMHLVLPDGTHVWLNAASSITYPTAFSGKERRVTITGEGYFEVVSNKNKPFFVQTNKCTVQVLGTHFNVDTYEDDDDSKITLLEGKIRLKADPKNDGVLNAKDVDLIPGQQAVMVNRNDDNTINVIDHADIDKAMDWRNGLFNFEGKHLHALMRELARWYDLEVEYEKGVPDIQFGGGMSRSVPLSEVLKGLEKMGVHFRIESDRRLIVIN